MWNLSLVGDRATVGVAYRVTRGRSWECQADNQAASCHSQPHRHRLRWHISVVFWQVRISLTGWHHVKSFIKSEMLSEIILIVIHEGRHTFCHRFECNYGNHSLQRVFSSSACVSDGQAKNPWALSLTTIVFWTCYSNFIYVILKSVLLNIIICMCVCYI